MNRLHYVRNGLERFRRCVSWKEGRKKGGRRDGEMEGGRESREGGRIGRDGEGGGK